MTISPLSDAEYDQAWPDGAVIDLTQVRRALIHDGTRRRQPVSVGTTLDLVIPAFNEELRIGRTIDALGELIVAEGLPVRLVVVDNGSVDGTAAVVDARSGQGVELELISCNRRGKGAAVRAGILHSSAPFVGYCDADLPVPAESLCWAVDLLNSGWEAVIGSRRCSGASYSVTQPLSRRLGSTAFRLASADLRGPIRDTQCGFKFFSRPLAQRLVRDLTVQGFAFDVELLARARHQTGRLIELPISWSDQPGSSFRAAVDGIRAFHELHVARRNIRRWRKDART